MLSELAKNPLGIVNEWLTFLDKGAQAFGLELGFARASAHPGVEHQKRDEPNG